MKCFRYFSFILLLLSCNPKASKDESIADVSVDMDTLALSADEYERTEEDYAAMRVKAEPVYYTLMGIVGSGNFLNTPMDQLIRQMYSGDSLITGNGSSDAAVEFRLDMVQPINVRMSAIDSTCVDAGLIFTKRVGSQEGEEQFMLAKFQKTNDEVRLQYWDVFDGDIGETVGEVKLATEYALTRGCNTLALMSESEGGDIDLARTKEINFFAVTPKGLKSILILQTENTVVKDYESQGGSDKNSTIEIRTWKTLPTTSNGYFDIEVNYKQKENGKMLIDGFEYYFFNGQYYVQQLE